ncbi:MAG TPA: 2-dehydropantoate 2-reductase [Candidatus Dormibacteraeota bacterium]|nr:2-dehydropantoate 2-reductase [Candidatus Dormibacteraeota bacterium]
MRVAVVGAGAIGGFLAAALARSGISTAVVARGEHLDAIRAQGVRVDSDLGSFSARVDAAADLRDLAPADALLLTFKAHQWPSFLEQLAPYAGRSAPIVTMQNGIPFWFERNPPLESVDPGGRIGALFDDAQTIGGVVHVSGHVAEPGRVVQSGGLRYILGEAIGTNGTRVAEIASVLRTAGLAVEVDDAIRRALWFKLVGNASLNPVSAATHETIGQIVRDPPVLAQVRALMCEVLDVGKRLGLVGNVEEEADARIAYASRLDDVKTSMLQDLEAGRPLELDPILGAAIELADRRGIPVPRLRAIAEQLHELAS